LDNKAALYLLETEKPITSTEYANLLQLVFNKTADLLVATNAANFKTQSTVLEALGIEAAALS
jgi:hypothetical protein